MSTSTSPAADRPALRGVSHQIAAFAWPVMGWLLFAGLPPRARIATAVYVASATALFAISALYHRITWRPIARQRMRRLDHAAIFLLIAGTYTPLCVVGLGPEAGFAPLVIVWIGAALGVAKSMVWAGSPKWITAVLAVIVGWAPMVEARAVWHALDAVDLTLLLAGGGLFTLGAVVYARKRPDPWPRTFGYHEIFHLLVVIAAACHLALVVRLV